MRFILILSICLSAIPAVNAADNLSKKRTEIINLYSSNLDRIWKLTEDVSPDFYLSSLGVSLLSSNRSNDIALNNKLDMAGASILYVAANTSLLMAAEEFKTLNNCDEVFNTYNKSAQDLNTKMNPENLCPLKETDPLKMKMEAALCFSSNLECQKKFEKYINRKKNWNLRMSKLHSCEDQYWESIESIPSFMKDFLTHIELTCETKEKISPWAKKVAADLKKACSPLVLQIRKDNIFLPDSVNLKYTIKDPRLPLIFMSSGRYANGSFSETSLFQGIVASKPNSLKFNNLFLIGPQLRAVYWLEMAEEAYERAKNNSKTIPNTKLDYKIYNNLSYSITGSALCNSPILTNETCLPYAKGFMDSIKERNYLNPWIPVYEKINTLANVYNSNKNLTLTELTAIEALASELEKSRSEALFLKNHVQDLIKKAQIDFNFTEEKNAL